MNKTIIVTIAAAVIVFVFLSGCGETKRDTGEYYKGKVAVLMVQNIQCLTCKKNYKIVKKVQVLP